ncbi:MAG: TerC family protein, partial [Dysgonomonas sp.]
FLSIMSSRLPEKQQPKARTIGLALAMICRIGLLFCISFLMKLSEPFYTFDSDWIDGGISGQSVIIFAGGLFLLYKSVSEIHHKLECEEELHISGKPKNSMASVVAQIVALDIVFSIDSVLTAVGMVSFNEFGYPGGMAIMITAVVLSILVMMFFATPVSNFVNTHPTVQMLGLSFLILIGVMLLTEAAHLSHLTIFGSEVGEIPKGYIYFAIAFSLLVEFLNMKLKKKSDPVKLKDSDIVTTNKENNK